MLERLANHEYFCYLDGYCGFFQIHIHPQDQEKTTFTCPYGTYTYRRMPFGLCNAPGTFQRGIEVDRAKIEVIEKLPPLETLREFKVFLGMLGSTGASLRISLRLPSH
ncbi:unnamed protein product [Rhodiola kirilowii]